MKYQIPKGLFDILPFSEKKWKISKNWQYLESMIRQVCRDYGYFEIRTPIFERTEIFIRAVGETSDIVTKEMYTFPDRAKRSMSLRPEGTASAMRAFIENNFISRGKEHKLFYIGPMFRYERPQSGRYRQHHQFGVETVGFSQPEIDSEVIDLLCELYKRLGIKDVLVKLNSVGDRATRDKYRKALVDYFTPLKNSLSEESKIRLEKNPLRILDSKNEEDKKIVKKAPSILDFLSDNSKKHFERVCQLLENINIPYKVDNLLVRGLDYYNDTVFEIVSENLGAQNSVGGGGRYDTMLKSFGGPDLPCFGFGSGMERILQIMEEQNIQFPQIDNVLAYFIPLCENAKDLCFELVTKLRHLGIYSTMDMNVKKIKSSLQNATKLNSNYCVIIGEEEMSLKKAQIKDMNLREQQEIEFDKIILFLETKYKKINEQEKC
jgi:histidyl-tRNA synthetase